MLLIMSSDHQPLDPPPTEQYDFVVQFFKSGYPKKQTRELRQLRKTNVSGLLTEKRCRAIVRW